MASASASTAQRARWLRRYFNSDRKMENTHRREARHLAARRTECKALKVLKVLEMAGAASLWSFFFNQAFHLKKTKKTPPISSIQSGIRRTFTLRFLTQVQPGSALFTSIHSIIDLESKRLHLTTNILNTVQKVHLRPPSL